MPKSVRLETREARRKLSPQHEPYWRIVARGVALGYRKTVSGSTWYVRRFNGGGYHKRTLGETDDVHPADGQLRLSWSDALRVAIDEPKRAAELKLHYTVREAFEGYFRHREARGRSTESLAFDRGKVRPFLERFGDAYLADLTTSELQSWRDSLVAAVAREEAAGETDQRERKRRAQATTNRSWAVIRAGLNWAFTTGRVDSDLAWRRVKSFENVDKPRTRFLSVKEAQALLGAAAEDFKSLAHGALVTGLRLGELVRVTAGDVGPTSLEVAAGKTGRGRTVPLTAEGIRLFKSLGKGKEGSEVLFRDGEGLTWTRPKVSRRMAEASAKAKLKRPATFHDLRRSYGSLLANAGARDAIIAAALGHSDTRMTRRHYAHLLDEAVAKEIGKRLPRFIGIRVESRK
ncbi:MAG: site-specific integrase [Steroidobacteraceae bacterium]